MGEPARKYTFSITDYLELEARSVGKHEYHDGELFAMAGATPRHSRIATTITRLIGSAVAGRGYFEYNSDLQIATSRHQFLYSDASVICGPLTTFEENPQAANNPVLIIEVLSKSTATYDRTSKFIRYGQIPTFREYVLIEQDFSFVEVRFKTDAGIWQLFAYEGLDETIDLQSIAVKIPVRDLYQGVDWERPLLEEEQGDYGASTSQIA